MTDPQPDIEAAPVKLTRKPPPREAPPARPIVIASTLEWAARMWLMDHDPADEHLFVIEAEEAFERMVDEQVATMLDDGTFAQE